MDDHILDKKAFREKHDLNENDMPRILTNYTPDQEGKDIKEQDVVRPLNHRYCQRYTGIHDEELKSWRLKSNARTATYGTCCGCMKRGPLGMYCMKCVNQGVKTGYKIFIHDKKILDSITLADIFKQGHEVARADRFCTRGMQRLQEFGTHRIPDVIARLERRNKMKFTYGEKLTIMRDYEQMVRDE